MKARRACVLLLLVCLIAGAAPGHAASEPPLAPTFPFVMPAFDSEPTPVDLSFLNPEPAGARGFVRVRGDHFVDGSGRRLRFLGTNFTFQNAFPPRENAPKVAARLRKLGMNVVRFHHIDNATAPRGLWLPEQAGFDPEQLDRLDWLIFQLKQHGIYTNLNLHVSREYPGLTGDAARAFRYGKALDNFHRPFIERQQEYARALLTHVNPYTGNRYADEPAVAAVEINNENTLLGTNWSALRTLSEPFRSDLTAQWRNWLRRRYGDTAALRRAWGTAETPLGAELLRNGDFATGMEGWSLQHSADAQASTQPVAAGPAPNRPALRIDTSRQGKIAWEFQLMQPGLTLEEGQAYTLTLMARAEPAREIGVDTRLDEEPWSDCGLSDVAKLANEWQRFSYTFRARNTRPGHVRVTLGMRNQLGRFEFAAVSLRPGGLIGLPAEQSLEAGNIPLPAANATPEAQHDFWAFLAETERAYVGEMVTLLKQDLKVQAPIIDTQASFGGIGGVYREAVLGDYVDMHAYWQHPSFPGQSWDGNNWSIRNSSLVRDAAGGTLTRLALHRVAGKPFTVSEYDHPAPNFYSAEMFPMLASFAAFQDWDGLYQFDYGNTHSDDGRISSYFTMRSHPAKVAFVPIAALLFRQAAVNAGRAPTILELPRDQVVPQLQAHGTDVAAVWRAAGAERSVAVQRPTAVRFTADGGKVRLVNAARPAAGALASETGEIRWETEPAEQARYTVNAPTVRVAVGYLGGRTLSLGDVELTMERTPSNWASIALAALDGEPLARSRKMLLVAVGRAENSGWEWDAGYRTIGRKWGQAPTRAEGIPLRVSLPGALRACTALDGTGRETRPVPVTAVATGSSVSVSPEYETVWYLLTR